MVWNNNGHHCPEVMLRSSFLCIPVFLLTRLLHKLLHRKKFLLNFLLYVRSLLLFQMQLHFLPERSHHKSLYLIHPVQILHRFPESYVLRSCPVIIPVMLPAQLQWLLLPVSVILNIHRFLLMFHLYQHLLQIHQLHHRYLSRFPVL